MRGWLRRKPVAAERRDERLVTAILVAILARVLPIGEIAGLANAGTLIAFIAVGTCLVVMRVRAPAMHRPFRAPLGLVVGAATIGGCLYLFMSLPAPDPALVLHLERHQPRPLRRIRPRPQQVARHRRLSATSASHLFKRYGRRANQLTA